MLAHGGLQTAPGDRLTALRICRHCSQPSRPLHAHKPLIELLTNLRPGDSLTIIVQYPTCRLTKTWRAE